MKHAGLPGSFPLLILLLLAGCISRAAAQPPIAVAPAVDMQRMYGGWYIQAGIPNWFEKGLVGAYDVYSPRPGGDIREDFYVRHHSFSSPVKHYTVHDWVEPNSNNARWRVQIIWPVNLPFLVLYVDPDYRFVLFGEDNRKMGWIYARDQKMSDADYQSALQQFQIRGYDTTKFRRWIQTPDEIGKPGFWSAGIVR